MIEKFEVHIVREIIAGPLTWPDDTSAGEYGEENGFSGNRSYSDLRNLSWSEASEVLAVESELIDRVLGSDNPTEEYELIEDELLEDPDSLFCLDLGVASSVAALSALGCVPFHSCNAGAFGGFHSEHYPLVAFYAKPPHLESIGKSVEVAGCGLSLGESKCLVLYADDIKAMLRFAEELIAQNSS